MNLPKSARLERKSELLERFPIGKSTLYVRINSGLFPPPISLGGRAVGWLTHEVDATIAALCSGIDDMALKELISELVNSRRAI